MAYQNDPIFAAPGKGKLSCEDNFRQITENFVYEQNLLSEGPVKMQERPFSSDKLAQSALSLILH